MVGFRIQDKYLNHKNKNISNNFWSISEMKSTFLVTLLRTENENFGLVTDGNKISDVLLGYPAARSGEVLVGDEILSIGKTPVSKTDDVSGLLAKNGETLILSIYRNGISFDPISI